MIFLARIFLFRLNSNVHFWIEFLRANVQLIRFRKSDADLIAVDLDDRSGGLSDRRHANAEADFSGNIAVEVLFPVGRFADGVLI